MGEGQGKNQMYRGPGDFLNAWSFRLPLTESEGGITCVLGVNRSVLPVY